MSLYTIILAAGESRRFGNSLKQLAQTGGQTLLWRAVQAAEAVTPGNVIVVLGCQHELVGAELKGTPMVINTHWRNGMGSSIATGIAALPETASAAMIALCDQVALGAEDFTLLSNAYTQALEGSDQTPIVCATYAGGVGVPAIFPRQFFRDLLALNGDTGAKRLLEDNASRLLCVPLQQAAIDIDTPGNLAQFNAAIADKTAA